MKDGRNRKLQAKIRRLLSRPSLLPAQASEDLLENFAIRLRLQRAVAGLTQMQMAERLGTSQALYSLYENARAKPRLKMLKKLAQVLNCTVDWLWSQRSNADDGTKANENEPDVRVTPSQGASGGGLGNIRDKSNRTSEVVAI